MVSGHQFSSTTFPVALSMKIKAAVAAISGEGPWLGLPSGFVLAGAVGVEPALSGLEPDA